MYTLRLAPDSAPTREVRPSHPGPLCLLPGVSGEGRGLCLGEGSGGRLGLKGSRRGGLALQDDREMIKPTEKIDKGAKQLQV